MIGLDGSGQEENEDEEFPPGILKKGKRPVVAIPTEIADGSSGLSLAAVGLLCYIESVSGGITVEEAAHARLIDYAEMVRIIDEFRAAGLIE